MKLDKILGKKGEEKGGDFGGDFGSQIWNLGEEWRLGFGEEEEGERSCL
jgi:hypothetical protein